MTALSLYANGYPITSLFKFGGHENSVVASDRVEQIIMSWNGRKNFFNDQSFYKDPSASITRAPPEQTVIVIPAPPPEDVKLWGLTTQEQIILFGGVGLLVAVIILAVIIFCHRKRKKAKERLLAASGSVQFYTI
jgi:sensor c-di-GMP phosphodiesterase-like protein